MLSVGKITDYEILPDGRKGRGYFKPMIVSSHELVEFSGNPCHLRDFLLKFTWQVPTRLYHTPGPGFLGDIAVVSFVHDPTHVLRQKHRAGTSEGLGSSLLHSPVSWTHLHCA